jgi:hypothetical protein
LRQQKRMHQRNRTEGSIPAQVTTFGRNKLRLFRLPGHKLGHKARSSPEEFFSKG